MPKMHMSAQRILVVDDEPQMRRVLRASLMSHGFEVIEAASGEDSLHRLNSEPCDCVLLDLNLPGLDGIDACRAIRARFQVPIIVVSIRDSEKDKAAAREAGANDYIVKPFGIEELLIRIQAVCQRKARISWLDHPTGDREGQKPPTPQNRRRSPTLGSSDHQTFCAAIPDGNLMHRFG